ncbi:MAG: hypothetical protein KME15_20225 [Drouetiella hepatica Uher 2000/2452]|jgi:hypothetical protein|uniref:Uncharacterized protein n=1 Tax=Drouetiella hepatica Uher 2000/2452 TaxID=904376 RepID=A0A951UP75_9CYAN|nr:hypothetical protein [Drouetiella hepatica Uher 2000/2452]
MEELKNLLIEWAALEPTRCYHHKDDLSEDFSVHRGKTLNTIWAVNLGDISTSGLDTLQGAIQEAIAYRGYLFTLESATDGLLYARIRDKVFASGAKGWYGKSTEGAIALLEAYVECLKGLGVWHERA